MMVMVTVPDGMGPGQQLQVDPDGPQGPLPPVAVTVRAQTAPSRRSGRWHRC